MTSNPTNIIKALSSDLDGFAKAHSLTPREMDIVRLLLDKIVSVDAIAKKLGVSPNTVKNHFQKIFQKTKTNAKAELLAAFIQHLMNESDTSVVSTSMDQVKMTILLADDDENFADLMRSAFDSLDHKVQLKTVKDGMEVLTYIEKAQAGGNPDFPTPQLILLDLRMPRMDGYEVLKALKENEKTQGIPVVALSGSDDPQDIQRIYSLGGASYMRKPSKFKSLVSKMDALASFWGKHSESPNT
jgi:DNA-binding NarL/FixJ family response regulator